MNDELKISDALKLGIEAHKSGDLHKADIYYTSILKVNPNHPDANHNMGALALSLGKIEQSLPFFNKALDSNPKITQFWLSLVNTLIKLKKYDEAKIFILSAKEKGINPDKIYDIEQELENHKNKSEDTKDINKFEQKKISKEAFYLKENGDYNQAIDILKKSLLNNSSNFDLNVLLSHCYLLNNDLGNASFYLEKSKKLKPNSPSVLWNEIRILLKKKNYNKALNIAINTNKLFPNDIEGIGILGACLFANNRMEESLFYLDLAIEKNPDYAEAYINRGQIKLIRTHRNGALTDLEKAHNLKPHLKQIWDQLISLLIEEERFIDSIKYLMNMIKIDPKYKKGFIFISFCNQKIDNTDLAIKSFQTILKYRPDDFTTLINLGIAYTKDNNTCEAIKTYTKAIKIKPNYAEAYLNIGNLLLKDGQSDKAIINFKEALKIRPDYLEALNNMGNAYIDMGASDKAVNCYGKILNYEPNNTLIYYNIANALKSCIFKKEQPDLHKFLYKILENGKYVRPLNISNSIISLLKFDPLILEVINAQKKGLLQKSFYKYSLGLSKIPLLLKLMSLCPLIDLELEKVLKDIRKAFLLKIYEKKINLDGLRFLEALALQCFTNEYIYKKSEKEILALEMLEGDLKKTTMKGAQPNPQSILCLSCYKQLSSFDWWNKIVISDKISEVVKRQILEPKEEKTIKSSIQILNKITNRISAKVRKQYEVNPYPRWVNVEFPYEQFNIKDSIKKMGLRLKNNDINNVLSPKILVAGCGTGQHSISVAARYKNSNVIAIDLSLSSLAYAKRKTDELGIKNIKYIQADILDLKKLNKKFDIIESVGVLHHMEDPIKGWKILNDCLRPSGLMKIGLYSKYGRSDIIKIAKEINQSKIKSNVEDMISFRIFLINSVQQHHKRILKITDFYSLSDFRDMLFHEQEHRFTIPKIKDFINKNSLYFCGFESSTIVSNFKEKAISELAIYDLDKWKSYEDSHPTTFRGMYNFWCQKLKD